MNLDEIARKYYGKKQSPKEERNHEHILKIDIMLND